MEASATKVETFLDKIKPPRLEDAGLEDCALPPESIKEAFLKAASAVRSVIYSSDDEACVADPWEDSSDALVGIADGVTAPSGGCAVEKGVDLIAGDDVKVIEAEKKADVVVEPGLPESGEACVGGIGGKGRVILGNDGDKVDGDEEDEEGEKEKPILAEGLV